MKIAYICADPGVPVYGRKGCSLHVQEVIRALRGLDCEVSLFARSVGGDAPGDLDDVRLVKLPDLPAEKGPAREAAALHSNIACAQIIRADDDFDIAYERYSLWSYSSLAAARLKGAVTVLEVNAPLIEEQSRFRTLYDKEAARLASLRVFAAADIIVAVSNEVADYLERYPQARGKVHVIPNGVNAERFEPAPALRKRKVGPFTVGFVGTLKPWHGVDILVEAFHKLRHRVGDTRLLIVGDGPEHSRLQAQCDALGIGPQVEFTGSVDPADVPLQLARMDVGVAPYPRLSTFYFSPLKAVEYLASGMPVIASDIGQLRDLVGQAEAGLLCEPGDAEALFRALLACHNDAAYRQAMGDRGRRYVLASYTWQAVAQRVLQLAQLARPRDITGENRR
jgi:glycosyltransferase involved in cell wall biosynthesis